jgi:hypothetical protein
MSERVKHMVKWKGYRGAPHNIRALNRQKVIERDQNICQKCGCFFPTDELEVHHIKARIEAHWLEDNIANLTTLCKACHRIETVKLIKEIRSSSDVNLIKHRAGRRYLPKHAKIAVKESQIKKKDGGMERTVNNDENERVEILKEFLNSCYDLCFSQGKIVDERCDSCIKDLLSDLTKDFYELSEACNIIEGRY